MLILGFGVSSSSGDPVSDSIRRATAACVRGPYVLGAEHPATHAYVWWGEGAGLWYRVDGRAPRATVDLWGGPGSTPTAAHWHVTPVVDTHAALRRTLALVGSPYSVIESAAQPFLAALPPGLRTAAEEVVEKLTPGIQCTVLAADVLRAAGFPCTRVVRELPGRFPEQFGQTLRASEGTTWCKRV